MSRIAVVGAGYVGITTAVCLAHLGNHVICSDISSSRISQLAKGVLPIVELGLEELLTKQLLNGNLKFTIDNKAAVAGAEFVFLCVPTPQGENGAADLSFLKVVAHEIGPSLLSGAIVINKSTVPIGSTILVEDELCRDDVFVISNPEFLREGSAIHDFLNPDRIIIGSNSKESAEKLSVLFASLGSPVMITDPSTAETIKYASNAFLATKISFINSVAAMCEVVGADVKQVSRGMGLDKRIGTSFLSPGPGWGGSCFPKDVAALIHISENSGYDFSLLRGVISVNKAQQQRIVDKAKKLCDGSLKDKIVTFFGLTFKAGTDDLRDSPALIIAKIIRDSGATVHGFDPTVKNELVGWNIFSDPYEAVKDSSLVVIATEWNLFSQLDYSQIFSLMTNPAIVDARNILNSIELRSLGFKYEGVGVR